VPAPTAPATPAPTHRRLLPRQELFAYHAARGASLAQASRLVGYSPQGARQRGSVLMANSDIRLRVDEFRRSWMAERDASIAEAVEEAGQVVEMAIRLERPTAALLALELKLKLRGIVHDRRFSLYTESPDDDLSTCLFDPREDEDPPLEPLPEAPASPAEPLLSEPVEQAEPAKTAEPANPPATPPEPVSEPASTAAAEISTAPAAVPVRTASAPVLRIPPVPARVLETFGIDAKAFPTVCPGDPQEPLSP
jgi:phage terminase small subunit